MSDDKATPPGVEAMASPGNLLFSGRGPTHFTLPLREGDVVTVGDLRGITLTLREVDIADQRAMAARIAELEAKLAKVRVWRENTVHIVADPDWRAIDAILADKEAP